MSEVAALYREKVQAGVLQFDPTQAQAIELLTILAHRLEHWKPGNTPFLFGQAEPAPKGLYLYGAVGRGKSMLMDLFFDVAPVEKKRRVHFHAFMAEVHAGVTAWRALSTRERKAQPNFVKGAGDDPIAPVAKAIADEAWLLCFDEFQVTDIADAMILGRLFEQLWARQVVVVATSNRHPRDLYKNGINRQLFLPTIALLEEHLDLHALEGQHDHRMARLEGHGVYHTPLDGAAFEAMDQAWAALTRGTQPRPTSLVVAGRELTINRAAAGCARMSFEDLCVANLGASDYLALAKRFDTLLLDGVPIMGPEKRNEAARFRILIDALYENKTKLILSAQAEPDQLYPAGDQAFEFERTASRLYEMRSRDYLVAERGGD
ncbi:cell division protein ZapE [Candidatus Phycosocius spiralis]|uniref:Cell division protein ZapE n=1 Tax=Candidatus Phycosocius spiralis TaxID=2815099 RepID=A0ABQ4PX94_9PROT|nr:cell division protein ZapE [Candidatus Phycosocius spiralis]GIU67709.1 cell division protein ZapE [Candidatus Phycosocius spiralis]